MAITGLKVSEMDSTTLSALRTKLKPIDITYTDLVTAIGASELIAGSLYRITDYATTHYMVSDADVILDGDLNPVINTGATEPLIVMALDVNKLSHEAHSEQYPQDIIHYDWNPENWKFDIAFSAWDEEVLTGWKGVIYFRHDTINDVSMGYDFRKVLNRRWKWNYPDYNAGTTYGISTQRIGFPSYTLGANTVQASDGIYASLKAGNTGNAVTNTEWWVKIIDYNITPYSCMIEIWAQDEDDYIDVTLFYSQRLDPEYQYNRTVKAVHFKPMKDTTSTFFWEATILQNNVFFLDLLEESIQVHTISVDSYWISNSFIGYVHSNILSGFGVYNCIGNYLVGNMIKSTKFTSNSIVSNFYNNSILGEFYSNCIGDYFFRNEVKDFWSNSIGTDFRGNIIAWSFSNNIIGDYMRNNNIGNDFRYVIIPSKTEGYGFRHNNIKDGVAGTSGAKLDFTAATHVFAAYNCEIYRRPDGTVRLKYMNNDDELVITDYNA